MTIDLSLGSFRQSQLSQLQATQQSSKEKNHHGNYNNLQDITTTNPFHFYTNPKWYESYFDPIIPRNVSFFMLIVYNTRETVACVGWWLPFARFLA